MNPSTLLALVFGLLLIMGGFVAFLVVRYAPRSVATRHLDAGDFAKALAHASTADDAGREDLMVAALAARHLLLLETSAELLDRLLAADRGDGEAWLERGLTAAYNGDLAAAQAAIAQSANLRSDLGESLTLHRAWVHLQAGDLAAARRQFEEVEVSIETKLADDLAGSEPRFAEWFLHAAQLWHANGDQRRATWAIEAAVRAAPQSALIQKFTKKVPSGTVSRAHES